MKYSTKAVVFVFGSALALQVFGCSSDGDAGPVSIKSSTQCRSQHCEFGSGESEGTCAEREESPRGKQGDTCVGDCEYSSCVFHSATGEVTGDVCYASDGLFCDFDFSGATQTSAKCQKFAELGADCTPHHCVEGTYCDDGKCAAQRDSGACSSSDACVAADFCDAVSGTCAPRKKSGERCLQNTDCAGGVCGSDGDTAQTASCSSDDLASEKLCSGTWTETRRAMSVGPMALALITGASAGIGRELARLFAASGHDLLLVARRLPELTALCAELAQQHGIKTRSLACDLSSPHALDGLLGELQTLEVDYLVNNAGFGTVGPFSELESEREAAMVELNVSAVVRLTRTVLPGMLARRRGRVLNIGSTAGFQPGPYMATYYATKAFVNSFTEALAHEVRGSGVSVTLSCPGPTLTEFGGVSGVAKTRLFSMGAASAISVAQAAYEAMQSGRAMAVHGFMNWLLVQIVRFSPRAAVRAVTAALNSPPGAARRGA